MNISKFLAPNPLAQFEHEIVLEKIWDRFSRFFREGFNKRTLLVLRPFIERAPLTYWDEENVLDVILYLEQDIARACKAINYHSNRLNLGLETLHRPSTTTKLQDFYDHGKSKELLIIANTFLPEYLRWTEHILGNLVPVIWSFAKNRGVEGEYKLKYAMEFFAHNRPYFLTSGYEDKIRNAIAHGEVSFGEFVINFKSAHPLILNSREFFELFDDLVRTCVSLGLAFLLFWLRNPQIKEQIKNLPPAFSMLIVAGLVTRQDFRLTGAIESITHESARQLHVSIETTIKSREQIQWESLIISKELIEQGIGGYSRFLFEVDTEGPVPSLVIIYPEKLQSLLVQDATTEKLIDAIEKNSLLWEDEPRFVSRIRAWKCLVKSGADKIKHELGNQLRTHGFHIANERYNIRDVVNLSVNGIPRIEIRAVLQSPADAENRELVRQIIIKLINVGRHRLVKSRTGFIDKGIPWPKPPRDVKVTLFRREGPLRWLQRNGWRGGNIVAFAEKTWGNQKYLHVRKPQEVITNINILYENDS